MTTTALPSISTLLRRCGRSLLHLQNLHYFLLRRSLFPKTHQPLLLSPFLSLAPLPSPNSLSLFSSSLLPPRPSPLPLPLFNSLLSSLSHLPSSLTVFNLLRALSGDLPDFFSFPPVLRLCGRERYLRNGEALHAVIVRMGLGSDMFVDTAVMNFYGNCSLMGPARALSDTMRQPTVVAWTALIGGYLRVKDLKSARLVIWHPPDCTR